MAGEFISEGEFGRAIEGLTHQIQSGFNGVHGRLDVLNGQTRRNSETAAAHEQRFIGLDREVVTLRESHERTREAVEELKARPQFRQVKGGALVPAGMSAGKASGYVGGGVVVLAVVDRLLHFLSQNVPTWLGLAQ